MDLLPQPDSGHPLDPVEIFGARTGLLGRISSERGVQMLATSGMPNDRIENHLTTDATALIYTLRMPADATISRGRLPFRPVAPLGLLSPGHSYTLRGSGSFTCSYCIFSSDFLAQLAEAESGLRINELNLMTPIESERLAYLGAVMLREAAEPGFGGSLFAESMGMAVAVELARLDGRQLPRDGSRRGSLAYQQMRQLESYVHDHLSRHLTLNELAQLLGISVRYLSSAVKRAKGVSIHRWIAECRISEARRLLAETDLLIHEIARQCAFHSADAFSTAFRASFGCAPDEFRRLALGLSLTERLGANP